MPKNVIVRQLHNVALKPTSDADLQKDLIKGYGVRQAARDLGVSHPALIKYRKTIAREFLPESAGVAIHHGANGNDQAETGPIT